MILLEEEPTLTALHDLISKVPSYPIDAGNVVELAVQKKAPKPVVDFYKSFPGDQTFTDKEDLVSRTDSIDMLRHQSAPAETFIPEED